MNLVNLQEYVRHWMILNNIESWKMADAVLFETPLTKEMLEEKSVPVYSLTELTDTNGIWWVLVSLLEKHPRLVVVLDALPVSSLLPALQALKHTHAGAVQKLTIINTSSWISWIKAKGANESSDCHFLQGLWVDCFDPSDVVTFFWLLDHKWVRYIRLQTGDYPSALYEWFTGELQEWWVLSLKSQWLSGAHGTILVSGRAGMDMVNSLVTLQKNEIMYDCFVAQQHSWAISDWLRDSLLQTERLIIVSDSNEDQLFHYAQALLFNAGLFETEVRAITPDVAAVTWFHDDYMYDQAGFGPHQFVEKLVVE